MTSHSVGSKLSLHSHQSSWASSNHGKEQPIAVSTSIRVTAATVVLIQLIVSYLYMSQLLPVSVKYTLDNYRTNVTGANMMVWPFGVMYLGMVVVVAYEMLHQQVWSAVTYYWFNSMGLCQTLWMLTFSNGTFESNGVSLWLSFLTLFCSIKVFRSLYDTSSSDNAYYLYRNYFASVCGWASMVLLVNLGIVLVYTEAVRQNTFVALYFRCIPFVTGLVYLLLVFGQYANWMFSSLFFWMSIVYGVISSVYYYTQNDPYTFRQPYHS